MEMRLLHTRTHGHEVPDKDTHIGRDTCRDRDTHRDKDRDRDRDTSRDRDGDFNRNEDMDVESMRRRQREKESAARVSHSATTSPSPIKSFNYSSPTAVATLMSPVRVPTPGNTQQGVMSPELFAQGNRLGNYRGLDSTYVQSHLNYTDGGVTSASKVTRADVHTVSPTTPIARTQHRTYMGTTGNVLGVITPSPIPFATSSPPDTLHTVQQSPFRATTSHWQNTNRHQSQGQNSYENDPPRDVKSGGIEIGGLSPYETLSLVKCKNSSKTDDCKSNPLYIQGKSRDGTRDGTRDGMGYIVNNTVNAVRRNDFAHVVSPSIPYNKRYTTDRVTDRVTDQQRLSDRCNTTSRQYYPVQKDTNRSTCSGMDMSLIDEVEAAVALINAMVSV